MTTDQYKNLKDFFPDSLTEIRDHRVPSPLSDTLRWFLDEKAFELWRDSPGGSFLHVDGSPGQGKSVLSKFICEHLETYSRECQDESYAVTQFFCFGQDPSYRHATDILRALMVQLVDCQEIFECLPPKHSSFSRLWDAFLEGILRSSHQRIFCIIDGFDECDEGGGLRADLLRRIIGLASSAQHRVKVLVTSRQGEKDLEAHFSRRPREQILQLRAHTADIQTFIRSEVKNLPDDDFGPWLKEQILDTLLTQAGSTYLWVSLVMKEVSELDFPSLYEVRRVLEQNPKPLVELYNGVVSRLLKHPTFARILVWVAYSARPLTLDELTDAINYDPSKGTYKRLSEVRDRKQPMSRSSIHSKLGTLLEVQNGNYDYGKSQEIVVFNHQSIRDFFDRDQNILFKNCSFIENGQPELFLARTCMSYLGAEEFRELRFPDLPSRSYLNFARHMWNRRISEPYYFFRYACLFWDKHIRTKDAAISEWSNVQNLVFNNDYFCRIMIEGYWQEGVSIFEECLNNIRHHEIELQISHPVLPIGATHFAIELDIAWLTELICTKWIAEATDFEGQEVRAMANIAPKSFRTFIVSRPDFPISQEIVEAAAGSAKGETSLQTLLEYRHKEFNITEAVLERAAQAGATKTVKLILSHDNGKLKITEDVLIAAAASGADKGLMENLLAHGKEDAKITHEILKIAATHSVEGEVMQLLLNHGGARLEITEEILRATAGSRDRGSMQQLLKYGGSKIEITEEVLKAAITYVSVAFKTECIATNKGDMKMTFVNLKNPIGRKNTKSMTKMLLSHGGKAIKVTASLLHTAASHADAPVMRLILRHGGKELLITDDMLVAAATNNENVGTMMQLLAHRPRPFRITEKLMLAVVKSRRFKELISAMIRQGRVPVTEKVLMTAIEYKGPNLALGPKYARVSKNMLITAARHLTSGDQMKTFLDIEATERLFCKEILNAAVSNNEAGAEIMRLLLSKWGRKVEVTEQLLKALVWNSLQGEEIIKLLLKERDGEITITKDILKTGVRSWWESYELERLWKEQEGKKFENWPHDCVFVRGDEGWRAWKQIEEAKSRMKASVSLVRLLIQLGGCESNDTATFLKGVVGSASVILASRLWDLQCSEDAADSANTHEAGEALRKQGFLSGDMYFLYSTGEKMCVPERTFSGLCLTRDCISEMSESSIVKVLQRQDDLLQNAPEERICPLIAWVIGSGHVGAFDILTSKQALPAPWESIKGALRRQAQLFKAAKEGREEAVVQLLGEGASPWWTSSIGHTPLWNAAVRGYAPLVQLMLEVPKEETGIADRLGRTPLFWAAAGNHAHVVQLLLADGASKDCTDVEGRTPLQTAEAWNAREVVEILRNYGREQTTNLAGSGDYESVMGLLGKIDEPPGHDRGQQQKQDLANSKADGSTASIRTDNFRDFTSLCKDDGQRCINHEQEQDSDSEISDGRETMPHFLTRPNQPQSHYERRQGSTIGVARNDEGVINRIGWWLYAEIH